MTVIVSNFYIFLFLFVSKEFGPKQWLGEMWQKNLWLLKEAMSSQKQTSQCSRLACFGRESLRNLVIFRYLLKWQQGAPTLPLLHSITFCFYFPCVVLPWLNTLFNFVYYYFQSLVSFSHSWYCILNLNH